MAAAVITAGMVQKKALPSSLISGSTERRLAKIYLQGTKATQNDWFLLSSYLSSSEVVNIASIYACVDAGSNVVSLDTFTYDSSDAKVVLSGATTGTSFIEVTYWTE